MKTRLLRKLRKEAREKYYVVKQGDIYYVMTKEQGEIHRVTQYPHGFGDAEDSQEIYSKGLKQGEEKTEEIMRNKNKKPDDIRRSMEYIEQDIRWINAAIDNIHNSLKDFHDIAFKVGKQYENIANYTPLIEALLKECLELLKEKYAKHAASISETKTPSE